jgi:peptidoglycan hydrolase CwlO-like protein
MITSIKKIMSFVMIMMIGIYVNAQNAPSPSMPDKSTQVSAKDEFVKNLKDFQPKLDDLNSKAKQNASKMPDFAKETSTLNDMVNTFKGKVDKFDATPKDQQAQLTTALRTEWASIQTQYKKATDIWTKSHPEDGNDK